MSEEEIREEPAVPEVESQEVEAEETQVESEETEGEEAETESSDESGESEDGEDDAPAKPRKPKGVQKRIAELTAKRREAEREAEYWREYASQHKPQAPEPDIGPKPKLADFDYDDSAYEKALDEYHSKRYEAKSKAEQQQQQSFQQVQQQAQKQAKKAAFLANAEQQYEDFTQVVGSIPLSEVAADVITASDRGTEVAYWLGRNPEEAYRINSLPDHMQAYEIAKVEARLNKPPKPQTTTSAPPPPSKVKGDAKVNKHPDDMTTDEWLDWRNKQLSNS